MAYTVLNKQGIDYRVYKLYYNGNCEYAFFAKSERAAKMEVSKYCSASSKLYKVMGGVSLCDEYGKEIAYYSPFFCTWSKATDLSYLKI